VNDSVKELKSENGKMRTDMQKLSVPRVNESTKVIKEASAKDGRKPEEQNRPQKR
jgi:hypothetical protein